MNKRSKPSSDTQKSGHKPGFKSVTNREDFVRIFGDAVHVPIRPSDPSKAGLQLTTLLDSEATGYFIQKELAPALGLSNKIHTHPQREIEIFGDI